jgi:type I restriction enzyme S subunit
MKMKSFWAYEIPLPPLNDQKRIAHLLGKVEGLIARRKQHLQQLDDLLKSVFLEMFGIQSGAYKRWTIDKLVSHTEIVSGVTKGKKYKNEELIETPYMRVANVQDGRLDLAEIKTISVTQNEINRYQLKHGDLLLTEGGDPDKLGRGSVWEGKIANCIHQNHIFRVRINTQNEINPYYLSALVGSVYGKAYFLKSAKQTTGIASINSTQLKNFPTVIPPINLQNHFAAIVEKVEGLKFRYQQSLTDLETLYGALSQKAFKGELDLTRVALSFEQNDGKREKLEERIIKTSAVEDCLGVAL